MGLRTIFKTAGHWLKGSIVKVDSEIQFDTTTNPEIDSTGGDFVWNTKTTSASSWKLRDPGTSEDILIADTAAKTITLHANYTASGFKPETLYLQRVEQIIEGSATPIEYFTEVQGGTEISNVVSAIGGTYSMDISIVCTNTSVGGYVIIEPKIGATSVFVEPFTKQPKGTSDIFYVNISKRVTLAAGNNTINLELSNSGGGDGRIYEANITLKKI
jgi:hypothetical protein